MKLTTKHLVLAFCLFSVSAYAQTPKQYLELHKIKDVQTTQTGEQCIQDLRSATARVLDSLQSEINADNKDPQLSTEMYIKRIDELFYSTPQGRIYKKHGIQTTTAIEVSQALDTYAQSIWNATDLLQYRMALEKDGELDLKYAIAPYVIHRIFKEYSTDEHRAKIVSLHQPRNAQNEPTSEESKRLYEVSRTNSPIMKFADKQDSVFKFYSILTAGKPCLSCHGLPKDELDAYHFKREGYMHNQKIGAFIFDFATVEQKKED